MIFYPIWDWWFVLWLCVTRLIYPQSPLGYIISNWWFEIFNWGYCLLVLYCFALSYSCRGVVVYLSSLVMDQWSYLKVNFSGKSGRKSLHCQVLSCNLSDLLLDGWVDLTLSDSHCRYIGLEIQICDICFPDICGRAGKISFHLEISNNLLNRYLHLEISDYLGLFEQILGDHYLFPSIPSFICPVNHSTPWKRIQL